jgi:hypothetical protein
VDASAIEDAFVRGVSKTSGRLSAFGTFNLSAILPGSTEGAPSGSNVRIALQHPVPAMGACDEPLGEIALRLGFEGGLLQQLVVSRVLIQPLRRVADTNCLCLGVVASRSGSKRGGIEGNAVDLREVLE